MTSASKRSVPLHMLWFTASFRLHQVGSTILAPSFWSWTNSRPERPVKADVASLTARVSGPHTASRYQTFHTFQCTQVLEGFIKLNWARNFRLWMLTLHWNSQQIARVFGEALERKNSISLTRAEVVYFILFKKRRLNHFIMTFELSPARITASNSFILRYCSLRYPKSFNLIHVPRILYLHYNSFTKM